MCHFRRNITNKPDRPRINQNKFIVYGSLRCFKNRTIKTSPIKLDSFIEFIMIVSTCFDFNPPVPAPINGNATELKRPLASSSAFITESRTAFFDEIQKNLVRQHG